MSSPSAEVDEAAGEPATARSASSRPNSAPSRPAPTPQYLTPHPIHPPPTAPTTPRPYQSGSSDIIATESSQSRGGRGLSESDIFSLSSRSASHCSGGDPLALRIQRPSYGSLASPLPLLSSTGLPTPPSAFTQRTPSCPSSSQASVSGTRSTSVNSSGPLDAFPFMLSPRRMGRAHSEGVGAHFPSDVFPAGQVGSSGSILHLYRSLNAFAAPPVHREPPFYASSGGSTTSSSGDADELANGIPLPLNITPTQSAAHSCERSPGPRRGADTVQVAPVHTTVEEESNGSARASLLPQWNPLDQNSPRDSVNEETGGSPDSAIAASHVFAAPIVSADGAFATSVAGCITGCNVEVPSLSPPDPEVPQGPQGLQRWAPTQLSAFTATPTSRSRSGGGSNPGQLRDLISSVISSRTSSDFIVTPDGVPAVGQYPSPQSFAGAGEEATDIISAMLRSQSLKSSP